MVCASVIDYFILKCLALFLTIDMWLVSLSRIQNAIHCSGVSFLLGGGPVEVAPGLSMLLELLCRQSLHTIDVSKCAISSSCSSLFFPLQFPNMETAGRVVKISFE